RHPQPGGRDLYAAGDVAGTGPATGENPGRAEALARPPAGCPFSGDPYSRGDSAAQSHPRQQPGTGQSALFAGPAAGLVNRSWAEISGPESCVAQDLLYLKDMTCSVRGTRSVRLQGSGTRTAP